MAGEDLGSAFAHVADSDPKKEPPELERPAGINLLHKILCRFGSHSLQVLQGLLFKPIEVGNVTNKVLFDQLIYETVSKTIDFHRFAACPMQQRFFLFAGARL